MELCFICIGILLSVCNLLVLKKMNFKNYIYYAIATVFLNVAYILIKVCIEPIDIINIFELLSLNILMYLSVCDINEGEMYVVAFAIYAVVGVVASFFGSFVSVIAFSAIVFAFLFLMHRKTKSGMGMGDIYAISCVSLFCSLSEAMAIILYSLVISLIYGLLYSLFKRVSSKAVMIRYVPFLFVVTYFIKIFY